LLRAQVTNSIYGYEIEVRQNNFSRIKGVKSRAEFSLKFSFFFFIRSLVGEAASKAFKIKVRSCSNFLFSFFFVPPTFKTFLWDHSARILV
jgi:hypothetical protein